MQEKITETRAEKVSEGKIEFIVSVRKGCKIPRVKGVEITEVKVEPQWCCRVLG